MNILQTETFAPHVGEAFDIAMGEATTPLTLVQVRPLGAGAAIRGMLRSPFSLLFRSASLIVLPQRTYRLRNAALGALDIFLVPVGRDREGVVYEAVFN
ncbi:MAG: hypothetical protein P4L64_11680 [Caulobacteraceae bacterium]|nr:hypothetical protein [Caulobacteraceae bacterium]